MKHEEKKEIPHAVKLNVGTPFPLAKGMRRVWGIIPKDLAKRIS
jgi:hypothetical protein